MGHLRQEKEEGVGVNREVEMSGGERVADDGCSLETPTTAAALTGTPDLPPL